MPDRNNQHLSANGYQWEAAYEAKVWQILLDLGIGWRAMHRTRLLYRGNEVLVGVHVPVPPVAFTPAFQSSALTTFADAGFVVTDASGGRTISSVVAFGRYGF